MMCCKQMVVHLLGEGIDSEAGLVDELRNEGFNFLLEGGESGISFLFFAGGGGSPVHRLFCGEFAAK